MNNRFSKPEVPENVKVLRTRETTEGVSTSSLTLDTYGHVVSRGPSASVPPGWHLASAPPAPITVPMPSAPPSEPDLNLPTRVSPVMEGYPGQDLNPWPPAALGNPDMTDKSLEQVDPDVPHDHQQLREGASLTDEEDMIAQALANNVIQTTFGNDWRLAKQALNNLKGVSADKWPHWAFAALAWVSEEEQKPQPEVADVNQNPTTPRDETHKNHGDGRSTRGGTPTNTLGGQAGPGPGGGGAGNMPGPVPVTTPLVEQEDKDKKESTMAKCSCCGGTHGNPATASDTVIPQVAADGENENNNPLGAEPGPDTALPKASPIATAPTLNDPAGNPGNQETNAPAKPKPVGTVPTLNDADADADADAFSASADLGLEIPAGPQTEEMRRRNPRMPMQQTDITATDMNVEEDDKAMCDLSWEDSIKAALSPTPGMEQFYAGIQQAKDDGHVDDVVHKSQVGDLYFRRYVASGNIKELHSQATAFREQRACMATLKSCASHTPTDREYSKKVFAYSARQIKSSLQRAFRKLRDPQNATPDEAAYSACAALQADLLGSETTAYLTAAADTEVVTSSQGDATTRGGSNMEWTQAHRDAVHEGLVITSTLVSSKSVAADTESIFESVMSFAVMDPAARKQMATLLGKQVVANAAPAAVVTASAQVNGDAKVAFGNLVQDEIVEAAGARSDNGGGNGQGEAGIGSLFDRMNRSANRRR